MEKYIAFGLYHKNEHGGHQEAMEPGIAKPVYLAKDVAALAKRLIEDAEGLAYNRELMAELQSLMVT